jgi:hypothetical protein
MPHVNYGVQFMWQPLLWLPQQLNISQPLQLCGRQLPAREQPFLPLAIIIFFPGRSRGDGGNRNRDLSRARRVLCLLSYIPIRTAEAAQRPQPVCRARITRHGTPIVSCAS